METMLPRTIVISGFPVGRTAAVIKQELPRLKNNSRYILENIFQISFYKICPQLIFLGKFASFFLVRFLCPFHHLLFFWVILL